MTANVNILFIFARKSIRFPVRQMSSSCIFCKIIVGDAPGEIEFQDDEMVVIRDIKPAAKFHYLVIPKEHIPNVNCLNAERKPLLERLMATGRRVLVEKGGDAGDVRLGFHVPPFNSVSHLHLHVISPESQMGFVSRCVFKPNTWWFNTVMLSVCVFCEIIKGKAPGEILFENNDMLVIKDIKPASEFHYLAISRQHIPTILYLRSEHRALVEELMANGREVLEANGGDLSDALLGFHVPPFNSVNHLHLHLISPQSEMSDYFKAMFQLHPLQFITPEAVLEAIGSTK